MAQELTFDEATVGMILGPFEEVITPELAKRFADAVDSTSPWFTAESPFGGPIAPPGLVETLAQGARGVIIRAEKGTVHAKTVLQHLKPVRVGSKIRIEGKLADKYAKRDKFYIVWESRVTDEQGDVAMVVRFTQCVLPAHASVRIV
ncbi:MAG: MaoC family dehydratase [Chloroflexi bacterium]|nr:MaoC family dehydratase [Chloroflexota bacterium]